MENIINNIKNKIDKFFDEIIVNTIIKSLDDLDKIINIFITKECINNDLELDAYSICIGITNIINKFGVNYLNNLSSKTIYNNSSAIFLEKKIKEDHRYNIYYKMFENPIEDDIESYYNPVLSRDNSDNYMI